jgi:hypothetical protein
MQRSTLLPLLCLPAVFGCAAESHDAQLDALAEEQPEDPNLVSSPMTGEQPAEVQADLEQLAALQVFEVGSLLARYPEGAFNCYGVCPEFEDAVAQANEHAAERLATLVEQVSSAIAANTTVEPDTCEQAAIEANLAALRALETIEVGQLIAVVPQNNPACYNLPCQADTEAAAQQTCERAATLARIVGEL